MTVSLNTANFLKPIQKLKTAAPVSSSDVTNTVKTVGLTTAACLAGQVLVNKNLTPQSFTDAKFDYYLKKNNYIYNKKDNVYTKKYDEKTKSEILNSRDGHDNQKITLLLDREIDKNDMDGFKEFLKLADGKALKYIDSHFDNLMVSYLSLKKNDLYDIHKTNVSKNSGYQDLVINAATKPLSVYAKNLLMQYKLTAYKEFNGYLRAGSEACSQEIGEKVNELANYIDTQSVDVPIKVYRTEGYDVLRNVKLNGESDIDFGGMMLKAKFCSNPTQNQANEIRKLQEFILDNEIKAHQPSFMSTSLNENIASIFGGGKEIVWEFEIPKGTKGVYLEPLNSTNVLGIENEFLLQKDSDIIIKGIELDKETRKWIIKAQIHNK